MKSLKNISIILLSLLLALSLGSCQSTAAEKEIANTTETAAEPVESAAAEETSAAIEESVQETELPAAAEEETPVSVTYTYMGYELTIDAYDGYALISYPQAASNEEVAGFLSIEAEKYGIQGVTYTFLESGELRLDYPEGIAPEERRALADTLANDLILYVTPAPEVIPDTTITTVYSYAGYELSAVIADGSTVLTYPSFITDAEVEGFFAFINAKNDFASLGVVYTINEPGTVTLTYPSVYTKEIVKAELDSIVNDLIAYISKVPVAVPVPEVSDVLIAEVYTYGGYTIEAVISEGCTVLAYPLSATDDDVNTFIAIENAKYGYGDMGVFYTLEGNGKAVFTYPESISPAAVSAELDKLISDLIIYITPAPQVVSVSMPEPEPIVKTYSYAGYSLEAEITEGKTVLTYPLSATDDDVNTFIAAENAKYGYGDMGVVYTLEGNGKAVFTYPSDITPETVASQLDVLVADLIEYITAPVEAPAEVVAESPEPEAIVKSYSYAGYSLEAEIADGKTVLTYPAAATDDEVNTFIAAENAKYGYGDMGVVYTLEGDGKAVLTYPSEITPDAVAAQLDVLVADLIEYITVPAETTAAPAAEPSEPVIEEAEIAYPFGVEPIVKAEGDTDGFYLYIGHTNDVHGRITAEEDGSMGYSKLDSLVKMARSVTDDILLLDAGDTLHGTNLANMFEGQTVLDIMNMIGYDAMVPGNHDFNYGSDRLFEAAEWAEDNASFRILSANITDEDGYLLMQPYQIYDFNGFKVCVIGLTTPDTKTKSHPKNTVGVEFMTDAVIDNAQNAIDLANELADFVIVLGHIGVVPDGDTGLTSEIICQNIGGIDLFIDGHSHTVMDGGELVNGTLIVSTGQYLNNLGVVAVKVGADGSAVIEDAFLLPAEDVLDPSSSSILSSFGVTEVPDDPELDQYVEAKQAELDQMLGEVVANIPMDLNGERADVRTKRTNLSSLICEAITAEGAADFTIINGGGIRASLKAGPVTLGDVNNVLPFTNIITVCAITPADVYAALEHGYSMLPEQNGAFSQTDLKVVYSASAPAGEKIKRVYLGDTLLDRNDTTTTYKVATNDFMAAGGDGYTMFGRVLTEGRMLNEVFCDYLSELYPAL